MVPLLQSSHEVRIRLARRFKKQQAFTAGYSPLYSRLFGIAADWLATEPGEDQLADWLVRVGGKRSSFDVPLLLLAGLHRDILAGCGGVRDLARYFPSVGGTRPVDADDLAACLRRAIGARQEALADWFATAQVQTNETARGFCWLLPVCFPGWPSIHLVDLGASAGLNLVAEQRHYRLTDTTGGATLVELGCGEPVQFTVASEGAFISPARPVLPTIRSRLGCDFAPLVLHSEHEEQTLAAFVWPDQPERLSLLRQGIAALHQVNRTEVPVCLHQVDLPDGLPRFLDQRISPLNDAPIVLYNTYLTTYLHDKGASLRPYLAAWASRQPRPVLWLQWETLWQGPTPPEFGWVGWTADLWQDGRHHHWHFAWTHPHGTRIRWLPGMADWSNFWRDGRSYSPDTPPALSTNA
jgi:hypothetical protein